MLDGIGNEGYLWRSVDDGRVELIGHTLLHEDLMKAVMKGRVEVGEESRERHMQYVHYTDNAKYRTYELMRRKVHDQSEWRTPANQSPN